jgi:uncharacterized protein with HEPN domain
MSPRSPLPRLLDMIEAIERIRSIVSACSVDQFEADWQRQWLVVRGLEITSEASRHLPEDLKARHPHIPWRKVAGIGNVLRHNYENVAPAVIWKLAQTDLPELLSACLHEREAAERGGQAT